MYIRVSTEEQCENPEGSIKNQEERLRQVIRHEQESGKSCELAGVFVDAGLSAKNMNRPALQRLLKAIRQGDVNLVMVTELSRLSRSTKDFCEMWEFFQNVGCEFHSLREHFDTTNAAGELMLKSFANFAEFERRQTAERISASFKIRAERGLYNGGPVSLGYKLSDTRGSLDVHPDDAEVVKIAFKAFLDHGTLSSACLWLNENNYHVRKQIEGSGWVRAGVFKADTLHKILTNKAYIGVKVFKTKEGIKTSKACWDAIIDEVTFARVQEKLSKNHCAKKPESVERYPFFLTEIIYCGVCGDKLCGKSAHGKTKKHPYYEHSRRSKVQSGLIHKIYNCDPHRIPAEMAEEMVWKDVQALLSGNLAEELLSKVKVLQGNNQQAEDIERLKNKIYSINAQIESLTVRLGKLPKEVSASAIYTQMGKLGISKKEHEEKVLVLRSEELQNQLPIDLLTYENFIEVLNELKKTGLTTSKKQKIVVSLIERIEVFPDKLEISFAVGRDKIKKELAFAGSLFNFQNVLAESSTSLTNGGSNKT
ncbi:MAG: recombinase family protein [Bacteriovoracaceae bacterium]|nr:recombinase family protein [Bacteriovoracaceae bacterium]